jgi:hypothetical protein
LGRAAQHPAAANRAAPRVKEIARRTIVFRGVNRSVEDNVIAIESKEETYRRLDASTDDADAVILAWHKRDDALRRQGKRRLGPRRAMRMAGWMGV